MMLYSKGDTIEPFEGVTALVLKDGLTGIEFYIQYIGKEVLLIGDRKMVLSEIWLQPIIKDSGDVQ